jgi:hypothetical protein
MKRDYFYGGIIVVEFYSGIKINVYFRMNVDDVRRCLLFYSDQHQNYVGSLKPTDSVILPNTHTARTLHMQAFDKEYENSTATKAQTVLSL